MHGALYYVHDIFHDFHAKIYSALKKYMKIYNFFNQPVESMCRCIQQRWSRELKARGQGHKKIRGQGQPFQGQTLSRPRTGMLEAKAKDQGHKRKCSPKQKKVFTKIFQAISK